MAEEVKTPTGTTGTVSSAGVNGPFPAELNTWNWGAFFLTWIWAIGNSVWIGLLALIGPIALIMAIVLGIKGNEWAWKSRKFDGVQQFKQVQAAWTKWGVILFIVSIVITIITWIIIGVAAVPAIKQGIESLPSTTPVAEFSIPVE